MVNLTTTRSVSRLVDIRSSALVTVLLFLIVIGGVWELYAGGAHKIHLLSVFVAVLCLATIALVALYFANRGSLEKSRLSQERFGMAMAAGKSVAWSLDVKTGQDEWLGDLQTMFGIPTDRAQVQLKDFYQYVHPEDRSRVADVVASARDNRTNYAAEFRIVHKDGTTRWVNATGRFHYTKKGDPLRMLGIAFDITDRKQAEEARIKSEEKFSKAFRQSPVAMTLTSARDQRYLDVNEAFERSTGWTRDEAVGKTPFDLNIWFDPERRNELVARVLSEGSMRNADIRYRCRNGSVGVGLASAELIEVNGEPCLLAAIADITERNQFENALRSKESELAQAQHLAHLGSWQFDVKTRSLTWSEELRRIHGVPPGAPEPSYEQFSQLFTPESWRQLREVMQHTVDTGEVPAIDLELVRPDGSKAWVSARGEAVRDTAGELVCIRGTTQDITDRKEAEHRLRESEARLSAIVNSAMDAIITIDGEQRVVLFNEAAERMFRCSAEEVKGTHIDRFIPPPYKLDHRDEIEQSAGNGETKRSTSSTGTIYAVRSNGEAFPIEASISRIARDGKELLTAIIRDVTERHRAEEALRKSEEKFSKVFRSSPMSINLISMRDHRFLDVNEGFEQMSGWGRDEVIGRTPLECNIWVDPSEREKFVRQISTDGFTRNLEFRYRRKDGEQRVALGSAELIEIKGEPCLISACMDVTERRRAEEALHDSEQRFRRVVEHIGDAVIADDLEGRITFANDRFLQLFGFTREQLQSVGLGNYIAPEYRDELVDRHQRRMRGENVPTQYEYQGLRADGTRMWLEVEVVPVTNNDGKTVGTQSAIRDITERKRNEQAIRESEERLRHLIDASYDWVYEMDQNGVYTYAGPQCVKLLGYEPSELIGKRPIDFMPADDISRVTEFFQSSLNEPQAFSGFRSTRVCKDGHFVILETNGIPIFDKNGSFYGYRGMARDITERTRAEEALRESEERFRRVVEHIGDALAVDNVEGRVVFANDRFLNLFSLKRDEIPNIRFEDYVAPEYCAEIRDRHDRRMRGEDVATHFEYEGIRRDGTRIWLDAEVVPIRGRGGNLVGSQKTLRDVTERKRAERALRDSEERLRHLISSSNDWVWEVDANGIYTYAGPQCRDILGYEPSEIVGKTPFKLMPPDESVRVAAAFNAIAAERKPFRGLRNVNLHKNGRQVVLETNGVPILGPDRTFRGYRGTDRDITERDRAEHALRESEERFRFVANAAPVMIWMCDLSGSCTYVNKPWLDFTGRNAEEELGGGWTKGIHPEDLNSTLKHSHEAFERRQTVELQFRLLRHDGEYRWIFDIGVPRFESNGTFAGYIGSCMDITERKLAEEAMATIGRRLIEAHEEERTRIGRELHDDINQRLALLAVELDRWREHSPSNSEFEEKVSHAQNRIGEIAKDIQALSHRLHSSKLEYLGLATAASSFCKEFSQQSKIQIDFTHVGVPRNLPQEVSLCLFRVLQEALQNALKYSGVRNFTVDLHGSPDSIELRVVDTGIGFEEQEAVARQGLGLISMRERLHLVHGEFSVKSKPGAGTTIYARVPLIHDDRRAMAG